MDFVSVLDNLSRQVPAREVPISAACSRIETHISTLNREDARSLRHALPTLLKVILGSPESIGWIELLNPDSYTVKADSEALIRLLAPKGYLFSALLAQVPDLGLFYEIPASTFPHITRKIIEMGQFELLPQTIYDGRLVKSSLAENGSYCLRLNMVEYFLFYFLYILSASPNIQEVGGIKIQKHSLKSNGASSHSQNSAVRKIMTQLGIVNSNLPFNWRTDASSDVFLILLKEYLHFMVPEISNQILDSSLTPPENILTTLLLKSSSQFWSRIDTGLKYSSFFTGILVEFWLNNYSYGIDEATGIPCSDPPFLLPSIDFLQALQVVSRHYSTVYALSLAIPSSASTFVDPAYKTMADDAFSLIKLSFYRYLRVATAVWPVDGTLSLLIDVWMSLISPWFHLDPSTVPQNSVILDDSSPNFIPTWRPYVISTFYLYQSLYCQFFKFSSMALDDFIASGECEDLSEAVNRLGVLISCLLEIMNPLLSLFPLLKRIESDLSKSAGFLRSSSSNEIKEIREQLRIFEPENFKAVPMFLLDDVRLMLCNILLSIDTLNAAIFKRSLKMKAQINSGGILRSQFNDDEDVVLFADLEESQDKSSLYNFVIENRNIKNEVKSLAKWSLQLRQDFLSVFSLQKDDFSRAQVEREEKKFRDSRSSRFTDNLKQRKRFISTNFLPRDQLQFKLSSNPNKIMSIAASNNKNPNALVKSYENGFLVSLLHILSNFLTNFLRFFVFNYIESKWNVKLPKSFWEYQVNLRFFAAYPNILFTILLWIIVRILIKVLL